MSATVRSSVVFLSLLLVAVAGVRAEVWEDNGVTRVAVRYNATSGLFSVTADEHFGPVASTVTVNNSFGSTGWDEVTAVADEKFLLADTESRKAERTRVAYKAMGYGEGYTTQQRILDTLKNVFWGDEGLQNTISSAEGVQEWIDEHLSFMDSQANNANDAYGQQLGNMLALLDGIVDGYNARVGKEDEFLNRTWLFYLNFQVEVEDVVRAKLPEWTLAKLRRKAPTLTNLHCSALIKVTRDDIYFSHATWNSFNSMLRQYKTYQVEHRLVTMSSYPGVIHSLDDWYMTHEGLAVMETTNAVYDISRFSEYVSPKTVSEFLRVMIANFLATDGHSWITHFSRWNSGTYNNQWMVLNMAAIKNLGNPLPAGTFWVAEQLPGETAPLGVTSADMTDHLNRHGYWASYNIPYFANVFNLSGHRKKLKEYGDFFSYTKCQRARIFARNQSNVVDLQSMKNIMRYNNYKADPFSLITNCKGTTGGKCNPPYSAMLAIAARGDLNPPGGEEAYGPLFGYLSHLPFGATDVKIATWSGMVKNPGQYTAHVICGPTSDQQPAFLWRDDLFTPMPPTYGLPKLYNYSFVAYTTPVPPRPPEVGGSGKWIGIGIGIAAAVLVIVAIVVVAVRLRSPAGAPTREWPLLGR